MGVTGSNLRLSLDGVKYSILADADFSEAQPVLNEGIATTGPTLHKRTKQVAEVTGVTVAAIGLAYTQLKELNARIDDYSISYTMADGSVVSGKGKINMPTKTTMEGTAELSLIPSSGDGFDYIPA